MEYVKYRLILIREYSIYRINEKGIFQGKLIFRANLLSYSTVPFSNLAIFHLHWLVGNVNAILRYASGKCQCAL